MGYPTKIATCCYCGTRAALVLGQDRHELSCSSCGAPLHDLKRLRKEPDAPRSSEAHRSQRSYPSAPAYGAGAKNQQWLAKRRKPKKRKGLMRYLIEEAVDALEDIFD